MHSGAGLAEIILSGINKSLDFTNKPYKDDESHIFPRDPYSIDTLFVADKPGVHSHNVCRYG